MRKIDIFITHSWRQHQQWIELTKCLDQIDYLTWRNFSVPWHDPALHPSRENEYKIIQEIYETQIVPVDIIIYIIDLLSSKGNKRWLEKSLEYGKKYNKKVYGVQFNQDLTFDYKKIWFTDTYEFNKHSIEEIIEINSKPAEFKYL